MTAKKAAKTTAQKPLTTAQRLDAIGIEVICSRIAEGESQKSISDSLEIPASALCEWIAAVPERSARAREARVVSARHWDQKAEEALLALDDDAKAGGIARARELASHYRWRASKYAPSDYGEKVQQDVNLDAGPGLIGLLSGLGK